MSSISTKINDVAYEYEISEATISRIYSKLRKIITDYYTINEPRSIGGEEEIVEMDKCLIYKNRNNVRRLLEGQKVIFEGIVREFSNEVFVEFIHNRKSETLIDVVRRRIFQKQQSTVIFGLHNFVYLLNLAIKTYFLKQ